MKKIGIITLNGNTNFGNKLQNYAVQRVFEKKDCKVETIWYYYEPFKIIYGIREIIRVISKKRYRNFCKFDKKIKYSKYYICDGKNSKELKKEYDHFFVGSDQVWNVNYNLSLDSYLLAFADPKQRNSISASFGISELPEKFKEKHKIELEKFNSISVREDAGKNIIKNLGVKNNVEVLIDPTMMLTCEDWSEVAIKPSVMPKKKYILNYFLGELPTKIKEEIERVSKEYDCDVINILDKNDPYYNYGPSEFLYLEKNAFLICTDSFHSCVFAMLFNRPFVIFERKEPGFENMYSRLDTLLSKFELKNRKFEGKIKKENLEHDYSNAYKILEKERKKADDFISNAIGYSKK